MTAATSGNFIDEDQSTLSPFGAQAAPMTLAEQSKLEDMKRLKIAADARATGNINAQQDPNGRQAIGSRQFNPETGEYYTGNERADGGSFMGSILPTLGAIAHDPVTASILLAPYGVLGAGAAAGGLASGGAGSMVGGATGVGGAGAGTGLGAGGQAAGLAGSQAGGPAAALAAQNAANGVIVGGGAGAAGAAGGVAGGALAGAAGGAAASAPSWLASNANWIVPTLAGAGTYAIDRAMSGTTPEQKRLVEAQEKMAEETARRREQVQQQSMDALGQQLLAFAPMNQAMASMYGPEAAFSQEQFAQMAANPMHPDVDPSLINYTGTDPDMIARASDAARRIQQYDQSEEARRGMIMGGMPAPGPGPAPISMPAPQAARRY